MFQFCSRRHRVPRSEVRLLSIGGACSRRTLRGQGTLIVVEDQLQPTPANEVEAWSSDPNVRFNRIHIIESMATGYAGRSGRRLYEQLLDLQRGPVQIAYHFVRTRDEVAAVMLRIVAEAEAGAFPLVHLEAHGEVRQPGRTTTSRGLVLASGELFSWKDLAPYLVAINKATHVRLLVFSASCFGADVATLFQALEPSPARVLIGPKEKIPMGVLETGTSAFYRTLLQDGDGGKALRAMNDATGEAFQVFLAEWLFVLILQGYYNDATTDAKIAARVEAKFIAPMVLGGAPDAVVNDTRRDMKALLANRRYVFDEAYRKFFFVDQQPDNRDRFRMSYDACFREGSDATGNAGLS